MSEGGGAFLAEDLKMNGGQLAAVDRWAVMGEGVALSGSAKAPAKSWIGEKFRKGGG